MTKIKYCNEDYSIDGALPLIALVWLVETFGSGTSGRWQYFANQDRIKFCNEEDYALFLLRWM
jgi:hypothetical protein